MRRTSLSSADQTSTTGLTCPRLHGGGRLAASCTVDGHDAQRVGGVGLQRADQGGGRGHGLLAEVALSVLHPQLVARGPADRGERHDQGGTVLRLHVVDVHRLRSCGDEATRYQSA